MDNLKQTSVEKSPIQPTKSSNSSLLRTISIGLGITGIGLAIGIGGYLLGVKSNRNLVRASFDNVGSEIFDKILSTFKFTDRAEEDKIQKDLSALFPNNKGYTIEVSEIIGNYATGVAATATSGQVWIAIKENGKWQKIRTTSEKSIYHNCSIVNAYKIPKEIYESCVNY